MKKVRLFTIEEDVCASLLPGWYRVIECPSCKSAKSERIASLHVALTCSDRKIVQTLFSQILVDPSIADAMTEDFSDANFIPVVSSWDEQTLWVGNPVPDYLELSCEKLVQASAHSVEYVHCECKAVERLRTNPLFLNIDETITARSIRKLAQNPNILILAEGVVDFLRGFLPELIVEEVYWEDQFDEVQGRNRSTLWEGLLDDEN